ncbi:hypothetical protein [Phaeodactylibacter xiamenensis]|uniref:hypothetical protein n=1 Tax=Phaeodactylibacter xiamenensis TaxID=1524460 RepID=UPI003BA8A616
MKNILLVLNMSPGELDWIIPILDIAKTQYHIRITVIYDKKSIYQNLKKNYHLKKNLTDIVDKEIVFDKFPSLFYRVVWMLPYKPLKKWYNLVINRLFGQRLINELQALGSDVTVLSESGTDTLSYKIVKKVFPDFYYVRFPHSFFINGNKKDGRPIHVQKKVNYDKMLVASEHDVGFYALKHPVDNIEVVGYPFLEKVWLEKFVKDAEEESEQSAMLLLSRNIHPVNLKKSSYDYLINSTIECARQLGMKLIVKPHPREKKSYLLKRLNRANGLAYEISYAHPLILAKRARLIVALNTSACILPLALDKLVIDFWLGNEGNHVVGRRIFKELGLVVSVDTKEDLLLQAESIINNNFDKEQILSNYKEHVRFEPKPSSKAIKLIHDGMMFKNQTKQT